MEQKKLVWIIFSAALVLLVAVGTALIWLRPVEDDYLASTPVRTVPDDHRLEFDPVEWVRGTSERPGIEKEPEADGPEVNDSFVIIIDEAEDGTAETRIERAPADAVPERRPVVRVPRDPVSEAAPVAEKRDPAPAPDPGPAPSVTAETRRVVEYWIQAGSYTSRFRAEESKQMLEEKGFVSRITTTTVEETNYYRVRLGPYPNQGEAEKFLQWLQGVEPFETSYISQVYVQRQVN